MANINRLITHMRGVALNNVTAAMIDYNGPFDVGKIKKVNSQIRRATLLGASNEEEVEAMVASFPEEEQEDARKMYSR